MELKTVPELCVKLNRSANTLHTWRRKGCPGWRLVNGRLYGNLYLIEAWRDKTQASKPGPKGIRLETTFSGGLSS